MFASYALAFLFALLATGAFSLYGGGGGLGKKLV